MKVFPWRTFDLATLLTPNEAAKLFAEHVGEGRTFRGTRVDESHFEVSRKIAYKNSFLPVISVAFEPRTSGGAIVHVGMRLHLVVAAFGIFWMTGATLGGLVAVGAGVTNHDPKIVLFGACFPLAGAAMFSGGFGFEASRAETILRDMFPEPPEGLAPYR
jgi:hypothetical protein